MLKRNSRNIFLSPNKFTGLYTYMLGNSFEGGGRNAFMGGFSQYASIPASGYADAASWILPQKSGGGAAFKSMTGDLSCSAVLVGGRNAEAALSATVTNSADLALIIQMQANITADGNFTNAGLELLAQFSCNIISQLTTTSAILEAIQILDVIASLSASGSLTNAELGALAGALANLSATITSNSTPTAFAGMSANITPFTELSPQSLASYLLNSALGEYNIPGTLGEVLQSTASDADLESIKTDIIAKIVSSARTSKYF